MIATRRRNRGILAFLVLGVAGVAGVAGGCVDHATRAVAGELDHGYRAVIRPQAEANLDARVARGELTPAEADHIRATLDGHQALIDRLRGGRGVDGGAP